MKCFKCEKEMEAALEVDPPNEDLVWEAPLSGVQFKGGWNFGSCLYDAMLDGIYVELIICDDCLKAAKGSDRMRERRREEQGSDHQSR